MSEEKTPPTLGDFAKRAFDALTPKEQRILRDNFGLSPASEEDWRRRQDAWFERLRSKTLKDL
jgi:hypothetical protein